MIKRSSIVVLAVGLLLMFAAGCTGRKSEEPGVVEYMTGAVQLKTYQKTRSKIDDINKILEGKYQEID